MLSLRLFHTLQTIEAALQCMKVNSAASAFALKALKAALDALMQGGVPVQRPGRFMHIA